MLVTNKLGPQAIQHVYIYPSIGLLPFYVTSPTKIEWHFETFIFRASARCIKFIEKTNMHYIFVLLHLPLCTGQFEWLKHVSGHYIIKLHS
jgi:hypothetical protein